MPADVSVFAGSRSGPQFGRRNPRRKPVSLVNEVQYDVKQLASFKSSPSYRPEDFQSRRPYMGHCCRCMPLSSDDLHQSSDEELGIRNILDAKQQLKSENVWITFFSKVVYSMRRPLFGPFPDLSMAVLTNRRVVEAVQKAARDMDSEHGSTDNLALVEKRAARVMKKMKASISTVFIKFTGWFLLKFLSIMHQGVLVHRGQMASVKKAAEKGMPMIYLPLHRSHLDYILITFILWNYDIRAPHVAAGDNMDIPFFSQLMRSLGGFFIRRRLDNGGQQKDLVYRAILNTYMLELLKKGESLEFFIEGGRTRTGRAIIPKGGLLSVVTEACNEGIIYDAYIVPVTFGYERLLEGNFSTEQMGLPKTKESFLGACRAIFSVLTGDFGTVRVNFAQPFSLREFLQSAEDFPPPTLKRDVSISNASSSGLNLSQQAMSLGNSDSQDSTRLMVKALAEHTVYISVNNQTPMSTHCLSFLFLTKCRQGGTLACLSQDMDWLREELRVRKVDVGFCGTSDNAVLYAQALLGDEVVTQSLSKDGEVVLGPRLELPSVFTLSYSANSITAAFALDSIVACAILVEGGLMPSVWSVHQGSELPAVDRDKVLTTAHHLCDLLQLEFVLVPPCRCVRTALMDKLEDFMSWEVLLGEQSQLDGGVDLADKQWADRVARQLTWDEEDDDDLQGGYVQQPLKVNVARSDVCRRLQFLHLVLAPVLESYLITAFYIAQSLTADVPEDDFVKKLGDFARDRARNKLVMYIESCGLVTLKTAVKTFQQLNVVDSYKAADLTMLALSENMGARDKLHHYIDILKVARN